MASVRLTQEEGRTKAQARRKSHWIKEILYQVTWNWSIQIHISKILDKDTGGEIILDANLKDKQFHSNRSKQEQVHVTLCPVCSDRMGRQKGEWES